MHRYAIALGSNRRTSHGGPAETLAAASQALTATGTRIEALSPTIATPPFGPAGRTFANAAAIIATPLAPPALLALLQQLERDFGRRPGLRWGPRPLDLDILLWSGGRCRAPGLQIPHPGLPQRAFVLVPLATIAPDWSLPESAIRVRHLARRLTRRQPLA